MRGAVLFILLCGMMISACGIWTHYSPVSLDPSLKWYRETSTLYLLQESTLTVSARLPELIRDKSRTSIAYSLAAFSDEDGQVIVQDIFMEIWDLDTEALINPTHYELSVGARGYPDVSMEELPDSLLILKPGQHRIAYDASIPLKIIDRISNMEVRFYVKTLIRGQQFIIDRKIRFHRINEPLMLISV